MRTGATNCSRSNRKFFDLQCAGPSLPSNAVDDVEAKIDCSRLHPRHLAAKRGQAHKPKVPLEMRE